ncbi:MAG: hypothetical protein M3R58_15900 [Pseudomonadota bacterium]|nr:hypothetical protein [Pseudomonadota bacterium]
MTIDQLLDPCIAGESCPLAMDLETRSRCHLSEPRRMAAGVVLESIRIEIARRLGTDVSCFDDGERRRIELWGQVEISVASDGTDFRSRFLEEENGAGRYIARADLSRPMGAYGFASAFAPLLCRACREAKLDPRVLPGPTGDWMRAVIGRTYRRYLDWNRLRRKALEFLRPDPLVHSLTRRTFEHAQPGIDEFNWVARHRDALALVGLEHPRLLPFLQLAHGKEGPPLACFESRMKQAGLTPSARGKLEVWGFGAFAEAADACLFEDGLEAIARYGNLLDRLQVMYEPPPLFTLLAAFFAPFAPDWFHAALLEEVESLEGEDIHDPQAIEYEAALAWLRSNPKPDANQQRAGWGWIGAQARKHMLERDALAAIPWTVPCAAFDHAGHRVVPITSRAELHAEGEAMRNCLHTFGDDCAAGHLAAFSIREQVTGRRVASFMLARATAGGWRVKEIAGKGNANVGAELAAVAEMTARKCAKGAGLEAGLLEA